MKAITKKAQKVMNILEAKLVDGHARIDNSKSFMAVIIEKVGDARLGASTVPMISVSHYYEQNGDLMADPDMVFIKGVDGGYYPISYQLDGLGIYREAVAWKDGEIIGCYTKEQRDQASFAGTWMNNIKEQQGL